MLALARTPYSQLRKYQRALARGRKKFTVGKYYKRYKFSRSGRLWDNFYPHCICPTNRSPSSMWTVDKRQTSVCNSAVVQYGCISLM